MRKITFDIETRNIFSDVGKNDPTLLDISIVGVHDSKTDAYTSYEEGELSALWPLIESADMLIGYNSDHFDIPLLNKYYPGDLTKIRSLDLMKEIYDVLGRRLKLDNIVQTTLGLAKSADGLQAYRWWKEGNIEAIREYCLKDVEVTKKVYDYAREHNMLKYMDGAEEKTIALDTSKWEKGDTHAMTHTLGF